MFFIEKRKSFLTGELSGPKAEIKIKNEKCIDDFFLKGDLGWAESYIEEIGKLQILQIFGMGSKKFP